MVLTFRSTTPETRSIVETDSHGRQRIAIATRDYGSNRQWDLQVRHPNGQTWNGSYTGDTANLVVALDEMLKRSENDFVSDKSDRPRSSMQPDRNRSVNDGIAPVVPIPDRRF